MATSGTFNERLARMELARVKLDNSALNFAKPLIQPVLVNWHNVRLVRDDEPAVEWREQPRDEVALPRHRSAAGCLRAFIRLADATDEQIERFAQRWGVLGIWPRVRYEEIQIPESKACIPLPIYSESTDFWRTVARRAEGMLLIAAALFCDTLANHSEWAKVLKLRDLADWAGHNGYSLTAGAAGADVLASIGTDGQHTLLAECITQWLDQICVTPVFLWKNDEPVPRLHLDVNCDPSDQPHGRLMKQHGLKSFVIENPAARDLPFRIDNPSDYRRHKLRPSRLFNAIVLQLVAVISSPHGVYRCDVCGKPFEPHYRKPREDRQRLCEDEECRAQAHRVHSRKYARKRRSEHSAKNNCAK